MKTPRLASLLAALALLVLPLLPSTAVAEELVTVVLKNGEKHEQVSCRVLRAFNAVELKSGERLVRVSFSDIEAVLDAQGNNIAPRLLGTRYRPTGLGRPGGGQARPFGTIVLKSGERLDDVHYALNPARRELVIPEGAQPRAIPYDSIATVLDTEGKDITSGLAEPPAEASSASDAPGSREGFPYARPPRPWRAAFVLDGGFDAPLGDYYEGTKGGFGFGGTLHFPVTDELALRGTVTRLGLGFDTGFGLVSLDPGLQIISQNYSIDALRTQVGLAYYQQIERRNVWSGFWYLHSSLGAIRHGLKGTATIRNISTGETLILSASDSDTKLAMTSGAGGTFRVSPRIGLNVSGDLDFVWTKVYRTDGTTSFAIKGYVAGIRAGVALLL